MNTNKGIYARIFIRGDFVEITFLNTILEIHYIKYIFSEYTLSRGIYYLGFVVRNLISHIDTCI